MIARSPHAHKAPPIIPSATEALLSKKSTQKGYLCKLPKFTQSKLNVLQYISINKNKTSTKRRADRYRTSVYRMFVCIYSEDRWDTDGLRDRARVPDAGPERTNQIAAFEVLVCLNLLNCI